MQLQATSLSHPLTSEFRLEQRLKSFWNCCKILRDGSFPAGKLQAIAMSASICSLSQLSRFFSCVCGAYALSCQTFRCCWMQCGMKKPADPFISKTRPYGFFKYTHCVRFSHLMLWNKKNWTVAFIKSHYCNWTRCGRHAQQVWVKSCRFQDCVHYDDSDGPFVMGGGTYMPASRGIWGLSNTAIFKVK